MMKVLIVDDSVSSRTDLKTMLNWEKYGFEIVGEAGNGSEAVRRLADQEPDLVITDMSMPVMNGVQLIEYIRQHHPRVKTIALSAYDDFDFVRRSMKLGAVDYILKHQLRPDKLLELLQAAEREIRLEQDKRNDEARLSESKKVLRHELIAALLAGAVADEDELEKRMKPLGLALGRGHLAVAAAEIDDFWTIEERYDSGELDVFINTFLDIAEEILGEWEHAVAAPAERGRFAIIFPLGSGYSRMYVYNRQFNILNRIRSEIKRYLNITASFGVSQPCPTIRELPRAYREAKLKLEEKFYNGKNGIYIEQSDKLEDRFYCLDIRDEKEIYTALWNLDGDRVFRLIDHVFENISKLRLRSHSTRMVLAELIGIVNKLCKDNGIEVSDIYSADDEPFKMMQKYETLEDIRRWISGLYRKLLDTLEQLRIGGGVSKPTRSAIAYIRKNFHHNISLTEVAEAAGVSAPYLSKLFKEECGTGFADYLNEVRIGQAKRMIERGGMKLSEVAGRVGFNNYNYFCKVFKKLEDLTPVEYEKLCKSPGYGAS